MERKQNRMRKTEPVVLNAILSGFIVLGVLFSVVVPIFEASDEVWHYPMAAHLARTWSLPVQPLTPGAPSGPWRQEASQPPLYYALSAALTAWIDTSDMEQVRHLNPHVAAGEVTPDGSNPNLVVHDPVLERFPWNGTVLAIHLVRLFSVALGAWAVYLTWALVHELYPDPSWLALAAAAVHAFTPMYLFISASVNNDNLIVPLCSWALLLMVRRIKNQESGIRHSLLLGAVIGSGLLTKASAIGLLPLAAATLAWEAWQGIKSQIGESAHPVPSKIQNPKPKILVHVSRFAFHVFLILLPALIISGWWFYRNFRLYGDWLGLNAFYAVLGTRDVVADLVQLWAERFAFAAGYWGNFGGLNVPMPAWIYTILNILAILAALGLTVRFVLWVAGYESKVNGSADRQIPNSSPQIQNPKSKIQKLWPFAWDSLTAARALAWAWPAAVFVSWIRWATITWSSQGRLIFSAIPMWSLALVMGLRISKWQTTLAPDQRLSSSSSKIQNLASRFTLHVSRFTFHVSRFTFHVSRFTFHVSRFTPYLLPGLLFLLCLLALPLVIAPAYTPPATSDIPLTRSLSRAYFGNVLRLTGFSMERRNTYPGETADLTLEWEAIAPTAADHSIFIHVLGEGERIIAQRDTFPGRGLVSTTWLEPGRRWIEHYKIAIPALAYSPDALTFAVGVYETATGARLPAQVDMPDEISPHDARFVASPAGDTVMFGDVWLTETPSPKVHFGKGMVLTGYDLSTLTATRGATLTVTLDWRCDAPVDGDYTISVQLIDDQWRKAAQSDAWPLDGAAPTSSWQRGQTLTETRALVIAADAAPGVYDLRLAVYRAGENGDLEHLPIVWEPGQMPAKSVLLTRVRVQ